MPAADHADAMEMTKTLFLPNLEEEAAKFAKTFSDPIHGTFQVHPLLVRIIDTPEFQRLRGIKALGSTNLVYPGCTHTRFEHCIGVSCLAGKLVHDLDIRQPALNISPSEKLCVAIAGLLHDLGHGPFSHLWETFVKTVNGPQNDYEHEHMSLQMFESLLANNDLRPDFGKWGLTEQCIKFIGDLIMGWKGHGVESYDADGPNTPRPPSKRFLYDIVANKRNGVDVDKWDYLARDSFQSGMNHKFDYHRLILCARVLDGNEKGNLQIAFRDKDCETLLDMFNGRFKMHKQVYQHRVVKVLDRMIVDALVAANPFYKIKANGQEYRMSQAHTNVKAFAKLRDSILDDIYDADDRPELKPARDIIHRIKTRRLYKWLARTEPLSENLKLQEDDVITKMISLLPACPLATGVLTDQILKANLIITTSRFDYGMGVENPVDKVAFYKKHEPDVAVKISKEEHSRLLPEKYQDVEILFGWRSENEDEMNAVYAVVQLWGRQQDMKLNKASINMSDIKKKNTDDEETHSDSQKLARREIFQ